MPDLLETDLNYWENKLNNIISKVGFRRICDGQNFGNINFPFEIIMANKMTNSARLQLADLVARPIGLSALKPTQENRAYDILKLKFHNKNGGYNGIGLKVFP